MWLGLLCVFCISNPAFSAVINITTPLVISGTDTAYDGHDIVVTDTTLTVDGPHTFNSVELVNSVLTHSVATSKLSISAQTITVDATSRIDVTARGLLPSAAVTGFSGGSHGGPGGPYNGTTNATYGDLRAPIDCGTGGRGRNGRQSRGGGAIKLIANELNLQGQIIAHGQTYGETTPSAGGGSGGSIWLDVGVLSGAGDMVQ